MEEIVPKSLLPYLNGLLHRMPLVKREWDLEDFCQEVSFKFLNLPKKNREGLDENHRIALLKVMATHVCQDRFKYLTRQSRDARRSVPLAVDLIKPKSEKPVEPFVERFQRLKAFLKPNYRKVLQLRLQGLTWKQVARKMKPSKSSNAWWRGFQRSTEAFVINESA